MSELTKMTVQALRDLARKALGRGHSRFKTKAELVEALQSAEKRVSGAAGKAATAAGKAATAAGKAATKVREATSRAAKAAEKMVETAKGRPAAAKPSRAAAKAKRKEAPKRDVREVPAAEAAPPAAAKPVRPAAPPPERVQPDPEGHFVARVAGEGAVREAPHVMTEAAAASPAAPPPAKGRRAEHAFDEQLGELPWSYGDDAFVALPRDPRTLFLYWDHAEQTLRDAWHGLQGGRAQLWVFAQRVDGGWDRVRVVDFALESRSYYIHDLDPGRVYRAEIHVVDAVGHDNRVGGPSNEMGLPPVGPSPIVDDRFMRLPWGEPLQRLMRQVREGGAFPDELRAQFARLSDWGRFGVPGGGSAGGIGAGGVGGVGSRPTSGPTSPTSPSSPFAPRGGGEGR